MLFRVYCFIILFIAIIASDVIAYAREVPTSSPKVASRTRKTMGPGEKQDPKPKDVKQLLELAKFPNLLAQINNSVLPGGADVKVVIEAIMG